jgi:hypothetical protein
MTFAFRFHGQKTGQLFSDSMFRIRERMALGLTTAVRESAKEIEVKGRTDIASAGKFGPRWTKAWTARVKPASGVATHFTIETFFNGISYAHIFEFGGIIKAKASLFNRSGLLWIPLSFAGVPKGMTAQEFGATHGGLFRVSRKGGGAPLLLSRRDRQPKFFGIAQVTMPKKFRLRQIGREVMAGFQSTYSNAVRSARGR